MSCHKERLAQDKDDREAGFRWDWFGGGTGSFGRQAVHNRYKFNRKKQKWLNINGEYGKIGKII